MPPPALLPDALNHSAFSIRIPPGVSHDDLLAFLKMKNAAGFSQATPSALGEPSVQQAAPDVPPLINSVPGAGAPVEPIDTEDAPAAPVIEMAAPATPTARPAPKKAENGAAPVCMLCSSTSDH